VYNAGMNGEDRQVAEGGDLDPRSLNALKHGLTASRVLAAEEEAFAAALGSLREEAHPAGPHEEALVRRMAHLTVRLDRAGDLERALYARCHAEDGAFNTLAFERLTATVGRYERAMARALAKTSHELERLQAKRAGEAVPSPQIVDFNW
jgi:hypothetical protein